LRDKNESIQARQVPSERGTFAKITYAALRDLKNNRDVTSGRMKKGAGGNEAVYVTVEMHGSKGTVELSLRDMLAAFTYRIPVEHASQKYFLIDGDRATCFRGTSV